MRLLSLRTDTQSGPCWSLDAPLAQALGVSLVELETRMPPTSAYGSREWATTLVIALLQLRYHDRADRWASLVEVRRNATPPELMRSAMEAVCALQLAGS